MIDLHNIKKNYASFDDGKIIRLAKKESKGLRGDVIPILIEEIKKRKLSDHLIQWIKAERRILSYPELQILKQKVKISTCTICNQNTHLEGYKFTTLISFLIGNTSTQFNKIICISCGKKQRRQSAIKTILFGWWSPSGLIFTPILLIKKGISALNTQNQSEELIKLFINDYIGTITLNNDSDEVIQQLLTRYNEIEYGNEI